MKSERIIGYDFARALAIIGMIFVNFKTVMLAQIENGILYHFVEAMSGKAAALFVVLAGVGITMMHKAAANKNKETASRVVRNILLKRAAFLFILGLSYYFIWPADILHYYGIYIAVAIFFITSKRNTLIWISVCLAICYMPMLFVFDYEKGWDWTIIEYTEFFTVSGFIRNLFFNGFHPVLPWLAFLLTGLWIGRLNLRDATQRKKTLLGASIVFVTSKSISLILVMLLSLDPLMYAEEVNYILGTGPMPPNIFYMLTGSSLAIAIICISVWLCEKLKNTHLINLFVNTGQLALSIYFAHVIVGMLLIEIIFGKVEQAFSMNFIFIYSCIFSLASIVFANLWKKHHKTGPLEQFMRYVTNIQFTPKSFYKLKLLFLRNRKS